VRVVLDTNVVVSAVFWGGIPLEILKAWAKGRLEVIASPEILWEYERTLVDLAKKHVSQDLLHWMAFLHDKIELIHPQRRLQLSRDPMDDMFLSCAVSENVICIVSGDNDLLVLKEVEGTPILKPAEFKRKYPKLFS
jgi:uncharacterized protein